MKIELANEINREMWFFDKKQAAIWPVFAVRESKSGDTIKTSDGQTIRTCAKNHAVFYSYTMAKIAQKQERKEFDTEYDELLKQNKLRRMTA